MAAAVLDVRRTIFFPRSDPLSSCLLASFALWEDSNRVFFRRFFPALADGHGFLLVSVTRLRTVSD